MGFRLIRWLVCWFSGAEGELQLRLVLPAREWKSREILGRGTSPRRLSLQWTRRLLGADFAEIWQAALRLKMLIVILLSMEQGKELCTAKPQYYLRDDNSGEVKSPRLWEREELN
ncbi:unnamed protein product [Heterotrigona itama]|uniref:Uncharacterized protein n=1 Tax=Heterotrigona itama TaxID=395501 RepID=A0A6V7GXI0_9HYME|nr:unnamed protein product [Heterotrigona itama]